MVGRMELPSRAAWQADVVAAVAVTFMAVPQGVAYALIAGLPPAAGLYAAAIPVIVGAVARSSRFVVTGPTNALSLLVGAMAVGQLGVPPVQAALLLALLVGLLQVGAGLLRLGVLVNYISGPVVLGYITGAGVLIGVGQWRHLVADPWSIGTGLAVAAGIVALRWGLPRLPGAVVMLSLATAASWAADFGALGVARIADLASIPVGLPPLTLPPMNLELARALVPVAIAATVLSLVESSSVARTLAAKTGEPIDLDRDFLGQGLANVAAAFFGGYPTSGSLSRSALNYSAGATSRASAALSGVAMLGVLAVLGPVVDHTPISALAGLLLVVAVDLVDLEQIRRVVSGGRRGDLLAFAGTLIGTWVLPLDQAILLGVAISIGMFLRRVRHLTLRRLVLEDGLLREAKRDAADPSCPAVRILHVEGQLFFAAAPILEAALNEATADPAVRVVILRMKRSQGVDATTAGMLRGAAERMAERGQHLILVGMRSRAMEILQIGGVVDALGPDKIFPTEPGWFAAMNRAIASAVTLAGDHGHACPLQAYLDDAEQPGA